MGDAMMRSDGRCDHEAPWAGHLSACPNASFQKPLFWALFTATNRNCQMALMKSRQQRKRTALLVVLVLIAIAAYRTFPTAHLPANTDASIPTAFHGQPQSHALQGRDDTLGGLDATGGINKLADKPLVDKTGIQPVTGASDDTANVAASVDQLPGPSKAEVKPAQRPIMPQQPSN
ncbi:hypothetical protein BC831DRAFT_484378 [Entophlyctis helioformis]|nr:hypothetical protein BC831DRAFT_484378 [Entophlyctis helioformis]